MAHKSGQRSPWLVLPEGCLVFFRPLIVVAPWALALEAEEVDFGQSLAICPVRPQNMQRLLSSWCWCSCCISLPSLPNLLASGDVEVELDSDFSFKVKDEDLFSVLLLDDEDLDEDLAEELLLPFPLDLDEEPFEDLSLDLPFSLSLSLESAELVFLAARFCSFLRSQYQRSTLWARRQSSANIIGLLM